MLFYACVLYLLEYRATGLRRLLGAALCHAGQVGLFPFDRCRNQAEESGDLSQDWDPFYAYNTLFFSGFFMQYREINSRKKMQNFFC